MRLSEVHLALRRRWYSTIAGLVLTAALGLLAHQAVPVKYTATAELLMLPPVSSVNQIVNPYLALGGLQSFADVVSRSLTDSTSVTALRDEGVTSTYTVTRDFATSGPMVIVTTTDATGPGALSSLRAIIALVPQKLRQLQQSIHVDTKFYISSSVVRADDKALVVNKSQLRAVLLAVAVGLGTGLFGTAMLDALLTRRKSRQAGAPRSHPASRTRRPRGGRGVRAATTRRATHEANAVADDQPPDGHDVSTSPQDRELSPTRP